MALGIGRIRGREKCLHSSTLDMTTNGLTRLVCEYCGHVAIRPAAITLSEVDRSRFARRSEGGRHAAEADSSPPRSHHLSDGGADDQGGLATDGPGSRSAGGLRRI
jgi:hypothetical protein